MASIVRHRSIVVTALLLPLGCGVLTGHGDVPADVGESREVALDVRTPPPDTIDTFEANPPSVTSPPLDLSSEVDPSFPLDRDLLVPDPSLPPPHSADFAADLFAPLGFPLLDITLMPDLLSMLLDALTVDLIDPLAPGGERPFLEELCRDSDIPDFRCRQRFGQ